MPRYWCRLKGDDRFFNVEVVYADDERDAAREFCHETITKSGTILVAKELRSGWPDDFEYEVEVEGLGRG